ncbi:MAG: outer membrane beta-barrel protein [Candidatus Lernaella stagnicola]|nr:outer membrane beta-barrel protein [Candidatus Lernaella stagnicola]
MKRSILVLAVLLSALLILSAGPAMAKKKKKGKRARGGQVAAASVEKGNILLGGDLNFSLELGTETTDPDQGDKADNKIFRFGMGALGGYFLMDSLEIGGLLMVDRVSEDEDKGKTVSTEWAIGPQAGYFYPVASQFSIFGLLGVGYAKTTSEFDPDAKGASKQTMDHGGFFLEPRAGGAWHLNTHVGLYAALFFRYYSGSGTADSGASDVDFDVKESFFGLKVGVLGFL